jgi:Ca2+-binding RTX toxin-like protein
MAPNTVLGTSDNDDILPGPLYSPGNFDGRADLVFSGAGDDSIDSALAAGHNNLIFTGSGENVVYAGQRDLITGGKDSDELWAIDGDGNRLSGLAGDDVFVVGSSNNRVLGGDGNDRVYVLNAAGSNYLNGGAGDDEFWLTSEPGDAPAAKQWVMDFKAGEDRVGLRGVTFTSLSFQQMGADTLLSVAGVAVGHFSNTSASTLNNQSHFLGLI